MINLDVYVYISCEFITFFKQFKTMLIDVTTKHWNLDFGKHEIVFYVAHLPFNCNGTLRKCLGSIC